MNDKTRKPCLPYKALEDEVKNNREKIEVALGRVCGEAIEGDPVRGWNDFKQQWNKWAKQEFNKWSGQ